MASLSGKRVVIAGVLLGIVILVGMVVGFSRIGRRPFVHAAALTEARNGLAAFGKKVARCAAETQNVPPSAPGLPSECARYGAVDVAALSPPARLTWTRDSSEGGSVVSYVDLNGDGEEEIVLSAVIECKMQSTEDGGKGVLRCGLGPVSDRVVSNAKAPPS